MPAVHSAHRVATKATRVVGTMGVAPLVRLASALRDVRVPDPLNGRKRETFRVTVRQPGRVHSVRVNRPGLALERNRKRGTGEPEVVVQPVAAFGEHLAPALLDHLRDDLVLGRGAGSIV